jgi:hypothetical protein
MWSLLNGFFDSKHKHHSSVTFVDGLVNDDVVVLPPKYIASNGTLKCKLDDRFRFASLNI